MASPLHSNGILGFFGDAFRPTRGAAPAGYATSIGGRALLIPLAVAVAGLVVAGVGWATEPGRFYFAYLVAWSFCLTIALGSLFFVMIHHIVRAHWSVVVRRIPEATMWMFPLLAVLSIPILIGAHDLYHWTHEELYDRNGPEFDEILYGKRIYLNLPFWYARLALYFVVWTYLAWRLYKLSLRQDLDPASVTPLAFRKVAAVGIPVFAITVSFASYDLLMSLDPHWFSTIFGVYIFAGAFWSAIAFTILIALSLQRVGGAVPGIITTEHYHDLGKWLFAFTVFWAYIAFSQYMLIWYGNIPEETVWFRHRLHHGWEWNSAALLIAHFILPFLILLPRTTKRVTPVLAVMAVWALVMQWVDLHWLSLPVYTHRMLEAGEHAAVFSYIDLAAWVGLFGLFLVVVLWRLGRHALVPYADPKLDQSLRFHNV